MPTFNYSTPEQLHARLRERFMIAEGLEAAKLAAYFLSLKDVELEGAFQDKEKGEIAEFKDRLFAQAEIFDALKGARGE